MEFDTGRLVGELPSVESFDGMSGKLQDPGLASSSREYLSTFLKFSTTLYRLAHATLAMPPQGAEYVIVRKKQSRTRPSPWSWFIRTVK